MSARTRLLVVSEPEDRLWPWPLAATAPLEYGEERTAGDEAVRRREGIIDEGQPPNAVPEVGGGGNGRTQGTEKSEFGLYIFGCDSCEERDTAFLTPSAKKLKSSS